MDGYLALVTATTLTGIVAAYYAYSIWARATVRPASGRADLRPEDWR